MDVAPRADGGPVKLRIVPTHLDEVHLYEPDPARPGEWLQRISGDRYPFESADRSLQALGFIVYPTAPHSSYYLRIVSTSSILAEIQATTPAESNRKDAILSVVQMVFVGFMFFALYRTIHTYLQRPVQVTGLFIAVQIVSLLMVFSFMGNLAFMFSGDRSELANHLANLILFANSVLTLQFHNRVLALLDPPRFTTTAINLLSGFFPVCIAIYLAGWQHEGIYLNAWGSAIACALFGVLGFTIRPKDMLSLRMVRGTYLLLSLSLFVFLLPGFGLINGNRAMLLGVFAYLILSTVLMLRLLTTRDQLLAAAAAQKLKEGELAMQQLALEKQYATDQERFTDMLTHELKTPLSVALMSLGALKIDSPYLGRIRRALSTMNDIVDRTRLAELVRNKQLPVVVEQFNASERVYECIEACAAPERVKASVGFGLEIATDSHLFGIITSNLIDNALKYSLPTEPVEVRLQQTATHSGLQLVVANTVGAAGAPDPAHVFDKYYRSAGAHSKTGSGLGLYLCQHLAGMIGARLSYRQNNQKVEFELWVPASES